jgi:hypothetical protein
MEDKEKLRAQNYTARLNLLLLGCSSATCPFGSKEGAGSAVVCSCKTTSIQLSIAIGDALAKAFKTTDPEDK